MRPRRGRPRQRAAHCYASPAGTCPAAPATRRRPLPQCTADLPAGVEHTTSGACSGSRDAVEEHLVTGGITSGPASPTRAIGTASTHTGVEAESTARTRPAVIRTSPPVISTRAPSRSAIRALKGVRTAPTSIIGKNARPVPSEDTGVLLSTDGGRGDEPVVGLAVRLRALGAEVRVCAPPDWPGGRQREMRTCRTRGSTLRETPVIRPASAGQRSTAASEVSR